MTNSTQKPAITLRDGALKATIWRNNTDNGTQYSVQFAKTYSDKQGQIKDSTSFSQSELLRIAHISGKAYDLIAGYREQGKHQTQGAQ